MTVLNANDAICQIEYSVVMRDDDHCRTVFPRQLLEHLRDLQACVAVEVCCGLIGEQQRWMTGERPRDGNALTLTPPRDRAAASLLFLASPLL